MGEKNNKNTTFEFLDIYQSLSDTSIEFVDDQAKNQAKQDEFKSTYIYPDSQFNRRFSSTKEGIKISPLLTQHQYETLFNILRRSNETLEAVCEEIYRKFPTIPLLARVIRTIFLLFSYPILIPSTAMRLNAIHFIITFGHPECKNGSERTSELSRALSRIIFETPYVPLGINKGRKYSYEDLLFNSGIGSIVCNENRRRNMETISGMPSSFKNNVSNISNKFQLIIEDLEGDGIIERLYLLFIALFDSNKSANQHIQQFSKGTGFSIDKIQGMFTLAVAEYTINEDFTWFRKMINIKNIEGKLNDIDKSVLYNYPDMIYKEVFKATRQLLTELEEIWRDYETVEDKMDSIVGEILQLTKSDTKVQPLWTPPPFFNHNFIWDDGLIENKDDFKLNCSNDVIGDLDYFILKSSKEDISKNKEIYEIMEEFSNLRPHFIVKCKNMNPQIFTSIIKKNPDFARLLLRTLNNYFNKQIIFFAKIDNMDVDIYLQKEIQPSLQTYSRFFTDFIGCFMAAPKTVYNVNSIISVFNAYFITTYYEYFIEFISYINSHFIIEAKLVTISNQETFKESLKLYLSLFSLLEPYTKRTDLTFTDITKINDKKLLELLNVFFQAVFKLKQKDHSSLHLESQDLDQIISIGIRTGFLTP